MMPILITAMQMLLLYIPTLSDVCLWGRAGSNTMLNGFYLDQGTRHGHSYYRLTSGCSDTLYIFWTGSRLEISTNLNISSNIYAYCGHGATHPNDCNSWYVYNGGSFQIDSNIYIVSDICPSWDCDQISTPTLTNGCNGTFDQKIGVNAWKSSSNSMYWYFDPYYFNWICNDEYSIGSCSFEWYSAVTEDGWIDLSKGESALFDFVYPEYYTRTVNCIGNSTPAPTNNPTASTTITPTASTSVPTNNPISSTTKSTTTNDHTSSTPHDPVTSTTDTPITSTIINGATTSSTIINGAIKQTSNNYAEKAVLHTTATQTERVQITQIDHESKDGSFWTIFAVLISFISTCTVCLCIVMVYKYKHNKAINDIEMVKKTEIENSQYIENNDDKKQGGDDKPDINSNTNVKFGEDNDEDLSVSIDDKGTHSSHDHMSSNVNMFTPGNDTVAALIDDYTPNNDTEDIGRIKGERNRGDTMGNNNDCNEDDKGKGLLKEWLEYKVKLPQYFDNFMENGYENLDIIKEITEKDELVEIGIVLKGDIVIIMNEIQTLNKNIVDP